MDEEGFLQCILASPKERTLRLVYADWLEERGDVRGEWIRIEEEMRQLPVFSDRYWNLKQRRNELRSHARIDWLQDLGYTDCLPVFTHGIPDNCMARWRIIREFMDRWSRIPLSDVGGRGQEILEVENRLGRLLPPSVREWVAFSHDVRRNSNYHHVLRDVYQMQELKGHHAVSLLLQGEGDYHWAVRHTDLVLADPPVYGFHWDFENYDESTFVADERNPIAPSVTAFAFEYLMCYTRGWGGGFSTDVADATQLVRDLHATFPVRSRFGETDLYEAENILVRLYPSDGPLGKRIVVELAKILPRENIPAFLWDYTRNGGVFHGTIFRPEPVGPVVEVVDSRNYTPERLDEHFSAEYLPEADGDDMIPF